MYSTGLSRLFVLKLMGKCFMSWRSDNKELMGRWCRCTGSVVEQRRIRREGKISIPAKTKEPTVEMKPAKKELKGKVVTSVQ